MLSKTIALDFDGTIAHYDYWRGDWHTGEPISGAKEFVQYLVAKGFNVVIHTARTVKQPVVEWLERHGFPSLAIQTKMVAAIYIDDRGYRFDAGVPGAYGQAYAAILNATENAK